MGTETDACMAAVPVLRQHLTGHMAGDSPVIDHESSVRDWAECGEPATAVHVYRCGHGHEKRRATCPAHAPQPGQVGCRECYDAGHECPMTVLCPGACGCRLGTDDADRRECGCDGGCCDE